MSIPNNEIWARSSNSTLPSITTTYFSQNLTGTYKKEDGWYLYRFDADVTTIGSYGFNNNTYLTDIILPETVRTIGSNAFNGCVQLENINMPEALTGITSYAFAYCEKITELNFQHIRRIGTYAFQDCRGLTSVTFGDSLYYLDKSAFYCRLDDGKLTEITLPATMDYILANAFSGQKKLKKVTFLGETPPANMNANAFNGTNVETVVVPYASKDAYAATLSTVTALANANYEYVIPNNQIWCKYTDEAPYIDWGDFGLNLVSTVKSDGWVIYKFRYDVENFYDCFQKKSTLTEIVLPDSIVELYNYAFSDCINLQTIKLPSSLKKISRGAFSGCNSLTSIDIPDSVTSIDKVAFDYCSGLSGHLIIPNSVKTIGESAFGYCSGLTSVTLGSGLTSIGSHAFLECYGLTGELDIPNSVKTIDNFAFKGCTGLTSVTLGSGLTSIGESVFKWCDSLSTITCYAETAPLVNKYTFDYVTSNGTLYYPLGADYSKWLSTNEYYLGYYGWTGVPMEDRPVNKLYLIISPETIASTYTGLTTNVSISTNATSVVLDYPDWITLSQKDDETYEVVILPETTGKEREGKIIFTAVKEGYTDITKTISVYQEASKKPEIILTKNLITFNANGGNNAIQVMYANAKEFTTPSTPEWLVLTESYRNQSGDNTVMVMYSVECSATTSERTTSVIFNGIGYDNNNYKSEALTIKQSAPEIKEVYGTIVCKYNITTTKSKVKLCNANDAFVSIKIDNKPVDFITDYQFDSIGEHTVVFETRYSILPKDIFMYCMNLVSIELPDTIEYIGENAFGNCANLKRIVSRSQQEPAIYNNLPFKSIASNGTLYYPADANYSSWLSTANYSLGYYGWNSVSSDAVVSPFVTVWELDEEGGKYQTMRVGSAGINVISATTNVDWLTYITYEDVDGVFYGLDYVVEFGWDVAPNTGKERTGTITYSGTDKNGNIIYENVTVIQFGTDTQQETAKINPTTLSMTLPASGGSSTMHVTYDNPASIQAPEIVDDWITITEVGSSTSNNITTKTYQITAQPSEVSRQAKVKFKADISFSDGNAYMENDQFTVYQLAPDMVETTGTVYAFRPKQTFKANGRAVNGSSLYGMKVGYKGVVIQDPETDVDWLIPDGSSQINSTYAEYDTVMSYNYTISQYDGDIDRTGKITFKGVDDNGNLIESYVYVTQLKADIAHDDDKVFDNYRGWFRDYDDKLYRVDIIANPDSESYGEILLSDDSPVVVSYTESDRLYAPMRTSTCTVRVVTPEYPMNIYTGKAQGTQVILTDEDLNEVKWCGYLQPNLYNQGYSSPVETLELEASDCLSSLQYIKFEAQEEDKKTVISFKVIVDEIMSKCGFITSYKLTGKMFSDTDASRILNFDNLMISENNFFSEEGEPWTLMEVLEEICKFYGLTCFQWGKSIYFMDYDMYTKDNKMTGYEWKSEDGWSTEQPITISQTSNEITAESYRDTGGNMSLDDVFNKVTVNCNYYNVENVIPDLFDDELLTNRNEENGYFEVTKSSGKDYLYKTYYRVFEHKDVNNIYYSPIAGDNTIHETISNPSKFDFNSEAIFTEFVGGNIVDIIHLNRVEANGGVGDVKNFERYLMISQLNRPWCGHEGTFHWENYNFPIMEYKNIPAIFIDNNELGIVGRTKPKNYLVLNAEAAFTTFLNQPFLNEETDKGMKYIKNIQCYKYMDDDDIVFDEICLDELFGNSEQVTPKLCFYLRIGDKWYNGKESGRGQTSWQTEKTFFEVPLESLNYKDDFWESSKSEQNNIETNLFLGTGGYKIELPTFMKSTADIYFAIAMPKRTAHLSDSRGGDDYGVYGNAYCFIKDLSLKIVNRDSVLWEDKDMLYENVIDDNNVVEGDEIDLKITSDNGKNYSFSNVATINELGRVITQIAFYNKNYELVKPEEAIIEKYVNQYSTPSIKETITVDMTFQPTELIKDKYWNKKFVIVGQELDYKYGRQRITLLEKK